jgi:hypothetical protein
LDLGDLAQHVKQAGIGQLVEDEAAFAPVRDQPGFTQRHQVLGKVRLPASQGCFQVTDAGFALPEGKQDLQPHGVTGSL